MLGYAFDGCHDRFDPGLIHLIGTVINPVVQTQPMDEDASTVINHLFWEVAPEERSSTMPFRFLVSKSNTPASPTAM